LTGSILLGLAMTIIPSTDMFSKHRQISPAILFYESKKPVLSLPEDGSRAGFRNVVLH